MVVSIDVLLVGPWKGSLTPWVRVRDRKQRLFAELQQAAIWGNAAVRGCSTRVIPVGQPDKPTNPMNAAVLRAEAMASQCHVARVRQLHAAWITATQLNRLRTHEFA
jgi:hypothetical protein